MAGTRLKRALGAALLTALGLMPLAAAPLSAESCSATSFESFTDGDARLTLNGSAAVVSGRLRVTPSSGGAGSAFTTSTISLAGDASFSTAFSFQFTGQTGGGADGLVFVVQTVSNSVGSSGGGIGYQGVADSVGVEFDNWNNGGQDDNSASHVGIDTEGNIDSIIQTDVSPDLDAGDQWFAWVDYDGSTDALDVRLSLTNERPATATLTQTLDLPTILGSTEAFVGFTSATGAATANHDVISWTFANCFAPLGSSEPPVVDAGTAPAAEVGDSVQLDATVTDADPEETVTTAWTSDAAVCTFDDATKVDAIVTCSAAGTYTLTLTANDAVNPAVSDTVVIVVTDPFDPTKLPLGYRMVALDGGVFTFGIRAFHGSLGDQPLNHPIVGGADDPRAFAGYWLVAADGGVFAFGSAGYFGSLAGHALASPVVEIEPTPTGLGYYLVTAAGAVYAFGDAVHVGDRTGGALNQPVIGMVLTPSGKGYYLVAQDGGIFSYGDAVFHGSMGSTRLNAPIDDLEPMPDGTGYYLVATDGGVFAFGKAPFFGSTGSMTLNAPVIAMLVSPDGKGYWLAARDGGVFTFGSIPFFGSMGSVPLTSPVNDLIH